MGGRLFVLFLMTVGAAQAQAPRPAGPRSEPAAGLRARLEADLAAHRAGDLPREELVARLVQGGAPLLPLLRERVLAPDADRHERAMLLLALPAISPPLGEEVLAGLIDSPLRNDALLLLREVGTATSTAALQAGFDHERPSVRVLSAQALGAVASRDPSLAARLAPQLRKLVLDARGKAQDLPRAAAALETLTAFEGTAALADLLPCLRVDGLGATALRLLVRADRTAPEWADERAVFAGPDDARLALEALAIDEEATRGERSMALQALRVWGTYETIPPLLELLEVADAGPLAEQVRAALRAITGQDLPGPLEWRAYWEEVAPIWAEYPALLETVHGRYAGETEPALARLGRVRDPRTFAAVEGLLAELAWVDPAARAEAVAACQALAQLRDARGAGVLIDLLAPEVPQEVRRQAVWALGVIAGRPGSADAAHWRRVFPHARPLPEDMPGGGGQVEGEDQVDGESGRSPTSAPRARRTTRVGPAHPEADEQEEASDASGE